MICRMIRSGIHIISLSVHDIEIHTVSEHTIVGIRTDAAVIVVFSQPHEYLLGADQRYFPGGFNLSNTFCRPTSFSYVLLRLKVYLANTTAAPPKFYQCDLRSWRQHRTKHFAIASYIQNQCGIEALTHLTCAAIPDRLFLKNFLTNLYRNGIHNLLALRGDKPQWMSDEQFDARYYDHASDLVTDVKEMFDFSVAGACYPEVHQEAASLSEDIANLKIKVDKGVDFLITQLFYDNETFFRFLGRGT